MPALGIVILIVLAVTGVVLVLIGLILLALSLTLLWYALFSVGSGLLLSVVAGTGIPIVKVLGG
jgi:hypothetical protein